ncbi:transcriptional regulatory protein [Plesiocystis pacifica SIR-1]|uniref:Transcriptional regulatory protein n=1 Tax=Plesiocystis pacifica SIR-1 TaxID=391625 RepID=A6GD80_9BACT|nr:transcriptional regulatory protein [Plesiocystis pacifica SIR-1]
MSSVARLSKDDWIAAAAARFADAGAAAVRVEPLAKVLGVSKGSFYWHFSDRAALLAAIVDAWEQRGTLEIIDAVEEAADDPGKRLWILIERTFGTPAEADAFEAAVRAWAAQDAHAQAVAKRVDHQRLAFVAELLRAAGIPKAEAKRRADLLYCTLIGEYTQRSYGKPKLSKASLRSLHRLLLTD